MSKGGDRGGRRPKLNGTPQEKVQMSGVRTERWKYQALAEIPGGRSRAVNLAIDEAYHEYFASWERLNEFYEGDEG